MHKLQQLTCSDHKTSGSIMPQIDISKKEISQKEASSRTNSRILHTESPLQYREEPSAYNKDIHVIT